MEVVRHRVHHAVRPIDVAELRARAKQEILAMSMQQELLHHTSHHDELGCSGHVGVMHTVARARESKGGGELQRSKSGFHWSDLPASQEEKHHEPRTLEPHHEDEEEPHDDAVEVS